MLYEGTAAVLGLTPGAIVITGSPLAVKKQKNLDLTAGSVEITGTPLATAVGRKLSLTSGAVDVAGSTLTFTYTPSGDTLLSLAAGAIQITGSALTVTAPIRIVCREKLTLTPLDMTTSALSMEELPRESITLTRYC